MRECSDCKRPCRNSLCKACERAILRALGVSVHGSNELSLKSIGGYVETSGRFVRD